MSYSEQLKQRAIELISGRSAGEVLRVLKREFPDDAPPDERTIRRWRNANESYSDTNKGHQEQLADIVEIILTDIPDFNNATVDLSDDEVIGVLEYNFEIASRKYSDWFFYTCFCTHLANDLPKEYRTRNYWEFLHEEPVQLIDILQMVRLRKLFKGTCPVCKDW